MGYTHYWRKPNPISLGAWEQIKDDAQKLIAASPVTIQYEDDDVRPPEVSDAHIRFNGVGEDSYETFVLDPAMDEFQFCKTAAKPYDLIVCAILAVAQEHAGKSIRVSSDGDAGDWKDGIEFASKTLGRPVPLPPVVSGEEKEDAFINSLQRGRVATGLSIVH